MSLSREQYINKLKEFKIKTPNIKVVLLSGAEVYIGEANEYFFQQVNIELMVHKMPFAMKYHHTIFTTPFPCNAKIVYKENEYNTFVQAIKSMCIEDFDSVNIFTLISIDGHEMPRCIDYNTRYVFRDVYDLVEVFYEHSSVIVPSALIEYDYTSPFIRKNSFIVNKN